MSRIVLVDEYYQIVLIKVEHRRASGFPPSVLRNLVDCQLVLFAIYRLKVVNKKTFFTLNEQFFSHVRALLNSKCYSIEDNLFGQAGSTGGGRCQNYGRYPPNTFTPPNRSNNRASPMMMMK